MVWSLIFAVTSLVAFGALARLSPCNPGQRRFGTDFRIDLIYFLVGLVLYGGLTMAMVRLILGLFAGADASRLAAALQAGHGWLSHLPLLAQAGLIVLAADVMQYWLHRAFHSRPLWAFHAVHHSGKAVDWTATFRIHPVNFVCYNSLAGAVTVLIGFSPAAFAVVAPFNFFTAAMVHANLDWTFGPLRYVFASPVFHRWHHADDPEIYNKNFAPTFSFLDVLFGTFYMPEGRLPLVYGAEGVPENFLGQLAYPFQAMLGALARTRRPAAPEAAARP